MSFHDIKIRRSTFGRYELQIDGKAMQGVRKIHYDMAVDEVPILDVECIPGVVNADVLAEVNLGVSIDDVDTAIECLQLEMKLNSDFKNAVVASAKSAITESGVAEPIATELAESVVERVFFGDDICWRQ